MLLELRLVSIFLALKGKGERAFDFPEVGVERGQRFIILLDN